MIQTCKFFTVFRQPNKWGDCNSVRITMNEDCDYKEMVKELAKNGIFFDGCKAVAPVSSLFRDVPEEGCVVVGDVDDDTLYFSQKDIFHVDWVPSFIDILNKIFSFINE